MAQVEFFLRPVRSTFASSCFSGKVSTPQPKEKTSNQPVKLAERVLAPGDGEAEPGEPNAYAPQPTKWATHETCKKAAWTRGFCYKNTSTIICRQLRRLSEIGGRYPRLGFAIAWG
jgi:hypothetical protein